MKKLIPALIALAALGCAALTGGCGGKTENTDSLRRADSLRQEKRIADSLRYAQGGTDFEAARSLDNVYAALESGDFTAAKERLAEFKLGPESPGEQLTMAMVADFMMWQNAYKNHDTKLMQQLSDQIQEYYRLAYDKKTVFVKRIAEQIPTHPKTDPMFQGMDWTQIMAKVQQLSNPGYTTAPAESAKKL